MQLQTKRQRERAAYTSPFTEITLVKQEKAFLTSYEVKPVEEQDENWD